MEKRDFSEEELEGGADGYDVSRKQADVAYAMVRGGKQISEILSEHGVSEEEFTEWVREGSFSEYAAALASGFAKADAPYIWNALICSAKEGNIQAMRLYFDIWHKKQTATVKGGEYSLPDADIQKLRSDIFGEAEE